jgi:hypothetical protein
MDSLQVLVEFLNSFTMHAYVIKLSKSIYISNLTKLTQIPLGLHIIINLYSKVEGVNNISAP